MKADRRTFRKTDRPLSDEERVLTRWILEHGTAEGVGFLEQLDRARVVGGCPCGCASIDFAIDGSGEAPVGVHTLGEFVFGIGEDELFGVMVFSANGILSGLEVYGFGADAPKTLPKPSELRPMPKTTEN